MKPLCLLALALALAPAVPAQTIAVIPKGTTHSFWKSIEAGARQAGSELGVKIIWKGPMNEGDRAQQIGVVNDFVASGVSAIVLAPSDATALKNPVRNATDHHIPVVIVDSALNGEAGRDYASLIATDNRRGGQMGGEELARLLGGKGKVVLLRYAEGQASSGAREDGFLEVMARYPGIEMIVSNRRGGSTAASAQDAAMNLLDKVREADGIFCVNESTTQGMLLALRQSGLAGHKKFVGFDTAPALLTALSRGEIDALVAQNPWKMGYLGVQSAVKLLHGQKVETVVDTGCLLVTRANLATPEVAALVVPH